MKDAYIPNELPARKAYIIELLYLARGSLNCYHTGHPTILYLSFNHHQMTKYVVARELIPLPIQLKVYFDHSIDNCRDFAKNLENNF